MNFKSFFTVSLTLFVLFTIFAQRTITGKVTSTEGKGLSDVYINTKEGDSQAFTKEDGTYSIEVSQEEKTLIFHYLDMDEKQVPITSSKIDVVFGKSKSTKISNVVITGFQKIDRKLFTGAANRLKGADVKIAGVPDITRSLQGQVAGVEVQNVSGTFGAAPIVNIRGRSSINGNNKPLFVIDGVVQEDLINVSADDLTSGNLTSVLTSGIAGINQEDIKDIQILKDISATAIYGAQALNGVIVITTKSGRAGKPRINYSITTTVRQRPDASDYNLLDAGSELDIYRSLYNKEYLSISNLANSENFGQIGKMHYLIGKKQLKWGVNPNNGNGWNEEYLRYYAYQNTDWFEVLFRNNVNTQHSLSMSTGNKHSTYYASIGYYGDPGPTESNSVNNYTSLLKGQFKLSKKLRLNAKLQGNLRQQRLPGTRKRSLDPIIGQFGRNFDINPFSYALNTSRLISPYNRDGNLNYVRSNFAPFNEIYELKHNYIDLNVIDIITQLRAELKLKDNLKTTLLLQGRYANTESEHKIHETANAAEAYRANYTAAITKANRRFLYKDLDEPLSTPVSGLPQGGFYNTQGNQLLNYYVRSTLEWSPKIGKQHQVNVLAGNEIKTTDRRERTIDGYGISYEKGGLVYSDANFINKLNQDGLSYFSYQKKYDRYIGNFFTGAYAYKKKYLLNGSFRYDGSNQLGSTPTARWLPSWNISAGWNVSEEEFMRNSKVIKLLKLKTTYGLTGSLGPNASAALSLYSQRTVRAEENEPGIKIKDLENKDLTWEKLREWNIGFELGLWDNRIYTEVNYYRRESIDLIDFIQTSGIGGIFRKYGNIGDLKAHGLEATLKTTNLEFSNFKWNTQFIFNYYESKITRLESHYNLTSATQATGQALLGGPQRGIYSIPFAGLDANGIPTFFDNKGKAVTDIDLQNTDDIASWLRYQGPVAPVYRGGVINRFNYKNWGLSFNIIYRAGNKIRLDDLYTTSVYGGVILPDTHAFPKELLNRWVVPGDENITNVPVLPAKDAFNDWHGGENAYSLYNKSTERLAKGDMIRLKDINISYNFPKSWLKNVGIQSASVSLSANNIWLIYSDKKLNGADPEFFNSGGVALPVQRTYSFNLNVNF